MIFTGIITNLIIGVSTLTILWLVYLWKNNPGIVDLGWAIGLTIMGLAHTIGGNAPSAEKILLCLLILAWGIRLGGYLFWTRIRLGKKEPRYETLQNRHAIPAKVFFLIHFMVQACFQTAVGSVFIFTAQITTLLSISSVFGITLWCVGLVGSIVTDAQLNKFKASKDNLGKVCQNGLWKYSRHPNYFFEIMLWYGFSLIGLQGNTGWPGLISPTILALTMTFITGPITEKQSLLSKPIAYQKYQQETCMIIPWLKKRQVLTHADQN